MDEVVKIYHMDLRAVRIAWGLVKPSQSDYHGSVKSEGTEPGEQQPTTTKKGKLPVPAAIFEHCKTNGMCMKYICGPEMCKVTEVGHYKHESLPADLKKELIEWQKKQKTPAQARSGDTTAETG